MAKILIVDDEELLRKAVYDHLKNNGFTVFEAANGKEGLAVAFRQHPDLILLDVIMPVMDGEEMMGELKKDRWGKDVPIIFLTNVSDPIKLAEISKETKNQAEKFDYLIKSDWKLEEVTDKINKRLRKN